MNATQFYVQDVAGNVHTVHVTGYALDLHKPSSSQGDASRARTYRLEDGSALTRVDNDTFQMIGTGAYLTLLRD